MKECGHTLREQSAMLENHRLLQHELERSTKLRRQHTLSSVVLKTATDRALAPYEIIDKPNVSLRRDASGVLFTQGKQLHKNDSMILDHKEFFSDEYLRSIITETDERCCCLLVHLDIEFNSINHLISHLHDRSELMNTFEQLLRQWRDSQRRFNHRGVPKLLSALRLGGKYGVAVDVQRRLIAWNGELPIESPLTIWLTEAFADTEILSPSYYPCPLSDGFLMQIAPHVEPTRAFAFSMLLSSGEWQALEQNYFLDEQEGYIVMQMLTHFRDKAARHQTTVQKLDTIVSSLGRHGYLKAQHVAFSSCRGWLKRCSEDSTLKSDINELLHCLGQHAEQVTCSDVKQRAKSSTIRRTRLTPGDVRKIFRAKTSIDN